MTPAPDGLESGRDFSDSKGYYDTDMCGLHGHKSSVLLTKQTTSYFPEFNLPNYPWEVHTNTCSRKLSICLKAMDLGIRCLGTPL